MKKIKYEVKIKKTKKKLTFFRYSLWLRTLNTFVFGSAKTGRVNCYPRMRVAFQLHHVVFASYFTSKFVCKKKKNGFHNKSKIVFPPPKNFLLIYLTCRTSVCTAEPAKNWFKMASSCLLTAINLISNIKNWEKYWKIMQRFLLRVKE